MNSTTTAPLTEDLVKSLAAARPDDPVVSLYLDVDGRRHPRWHDCEARFDRLARTVDVNQAPLAHAMNRIDQYVRSGIDRSQVRGLAVFAAGKDLWHAIELPVAVRDQLVVDHVAHVRQLEVALLAQRAFAVLLVDRQRARLFRFEGGGLTEHTELFDALPRHEDEAGGRDRGHESRPGIETAVAHHLKRAADAAFTAWQAQPFDHLILGGAEDVLHQLERDLHTYLRERIAARINVAATATDAQIADAAFAVESDVERRRQAALVERVRNGGKAARGLPDVLSALADRRVDTLLVSLGFDAPGWHCQACAALASKGPACPRCSAAMTKVEDVVEEAVDEALLHGCAVEVCDGDADLDVLGGIGALLRY